MGTEKIVHTEKQNQIQCDIDIALSCNRISFLAAVRLKGFEHMLTFEPR